MIRVLTILALLIAGARAAPERFQCPAPDAVSGATRLVELQVGASVGRPGSTIMCKYDKGEPRFFERSGKCSAYPVSRIADAPPKAVIQVCLTKIGAVGDCAALCAAAP